MDGITQILMIMFLQYVYQKESDLDGTSLAFPHWIYWRQKSRGYPAAFTQYTATYTHWEYTFYSKPNVFCVIFTKQLKHTIFSLFLSLPVEIFEMSQDLLKIDYRPREENLCFKLIRDNVDQTLWLVSYIEL